MRNDEILGLSSAAVLDSATSAKPHPELRRAVGTPIGTRREMPSDFVEDEDTAAFLRNGGRVRRVRRGLIPQSRFGRIAAAVLAICLIAAMCLCGAAIHHFLLTDIHFRLHDSSAIELDGNAHVTHAQMLAIFGGDIDHNLLQIPLADRRAEVEKIPWVEHATVIRLLPNRLRIHVAERIPVAFTRQGNTIGMVDAQGVLLDMPSDAPGNPNYSFPVVTGFTPQDSPEQRLQRMHTFTAFEKELDSAGHKVTADLSEVDLSDPEDVKALVPDHTSEVLVHFGSEDFLSRYDRFREHIGEWRNQYPRLSSVDMRYERQIVLQQSPQRESVPATEAASDHSSGSAAHTSQTGSSSPAIARTVSPIHTPPAASAKQATTAANPKSLTAPIPSTNAHPTAKAAVKPGTKAVDPKSAETTRKVDAIKAWMANREKLREAAKPKTPPTPAN